MIEKKLYKKNLFITSLLLFNTLASANISGVVYRDYNLNSQQDSIEPGISNITLKAYDDQGLAISSTTDDLGYFNLPTEENHMYRVELVNIPNYLQPSVHTGVSTSVNDRPTTFIEEDGAEELKIGLTNPSEYTGENPKILATTIVAGDESTLHTLKLFNYNETDHINNTDNVTNLISLGDTGTTWGLAYDKKRKKIYSSALLRRHAIIGASGLGAIYSTDITDINNPSTSLFTSILDTGFIDSSTRNIDGTFLSHDTIYDEVGKMGLGDLDISEDFNTLYTINLNTQELVEIDIETQKQTLHTIENPFGLDCPNADVQSWGLAVHDNKIYIGSVCSSNIDIGSAVSIWDGNTYTTLITTPLNYDRESTYHTDDAVAESYWGNWENNYQELFDINKTIGSHNVIINHVQPILADIEFTEDESLILGYIDRTSLQTGFDNYSPNLDDYELYSGIAAGDIRKICKVNNTYYNEGEAECPQHNRNIDKMIPEFFIGDYHDISDDSRIHNEIALGGLLYRKGSNRVATTAFDPMDQNSAVSRSGILFLDNTSGAHLGDQLLNGTDTEAGVETGLSKTAAMGDIEILSDAAPIEVGNYVWSDLNSNGIQDPSEPSIPNVVVTLYKDNIKICSATTDENGYYYFGGPDNTNLCGNDALETNTDYTLKINLNDLALNNQVPTLMNRTADNADSDGDNGEIDTEASTIQFRTGEAGENNHDLDFGFRPFFDLALIKTINTALTSSPYEPGDTVTFTITVYNQGKVDASDIQINDYIPEGLILDDDNWIQSDSIATLKEPIASLLHDSYINKDITFKIANDFQGTSIINNAEIQSASGGIDIDSKPNSESGFIPDAIDDDITDTNGGDDYDLSTLPVTQTFDLALIKTVNSNLMYEPGDSVTFTITVLNQGTLDATEIQINDYIPEGLILDDDNWIQTDSIATLKEPIASLLHDSNISKDITFKITDDFLINSITNNAEIQSASGGVDIDSTPNNELGTTPDPLNDDVLDTNGGDDYDSEVIVVTIPILSGTLFNDGNGDNNVNGIPFSKPDDIQLYVNLIDANGEVLAAKPLADDGSYEFDFDDGVRANSCYSVVLSQIQGDVGESMPSTILPDTWNNTGENLNNTSDGNDGDSNGIIQVCIGTLDVPHVDFGINKAPTTEDNAYPVEINPGEDICVSTPDLSNQDYENGIATTVTILDLPSEGILYYDGDLVQPNMTIYHFDNSKLCADPYDGDVNIVFTYKVIDKEGISSNISTISMPFSSSDEIIPTPTPTPTPIDEGEKTSDITEDSVTIHWNEISDAYGYKIYQDGILITVVDNNTLTYTLTNLKSAEEYTYTVYVLEDIGETQIMEVTVKTKIMDWLIAIYHIILG